MKRIILERPKGDIIGNVAAMSLILIIVAVITSCAITNLFTQEAVIQSIVWLLLIGLVIYVGVKEEGIICLTIGFLGGLSRNRFCEIIEQSHVASNRSVGKQVAYGFTLFGCTFYYFKIDTARIVSLDWSAEQGSHRVGSDCNDWNVWLWYKVSEEDKHQDGTYRPNETLHTIGDSGSRKQVEALGRRLITLLSDAGIVLVEVPKEQDSRNAFLIGPDYRRVE